MIIAVSIIGFLVLIGFAASWEEETEIRKIQYALKALEEGKEAEFRALVKRFKCPPRWKQNI